MEEKVLRIKKKLQEKYYHMNDTWLDDCLDYNFSENPEANDEETLMFVTTQWQLSDLREIANEKGCLPNDLAQQKCTLLPGKYILQVEKGYDIATSKYKQLEAIRKISNENIAATETEQTQPWEVKSKRMMELSLTDGIQDVKAIEYKPIALLKDVILPGFKVMIKGPVQCRRGVILMTTVNFENIGGEVEPLLIKNAKENLLARALGLEENPDPYNNTTETPTNETAEDPTTLFEDDFDVNLEELSELESQTQKKTDKSSNNNSNQSRGRSTPKVGESRGNNLNGPRNLMTPIDKRRSVVDLPVCFEQTEENESIEFPDDDEDFMDFKVPELPHKGGDNKPKPSTSSLSPSEVIEDDDDLILLDDVESSGINVAVNGRSSNLAQVRIDDDLGNVEWDDYDVEEATQKAIEESLNVPKPQNERKILQPVASDQNEEKKVGQSNNVMSFFKKVPAKAESPVRASKKRPSDILTPPPSTSSKILCNRDTPKTSKSGGSILDFFKKTDKAQSSAEAPPQPKLCDFIIELKKLSLSEEKITKKIWGRMERVGKLQTTEGNWSLDCIISDGTESLEVIIASMLLKKEIGYSCAEFMKKKKLRKTNPEIDKMLRIALRNADEKFKNLDALLDVEFSINATPKVVKITELTHAEREKIRSCRKKFS